MQPTISDYEWKDELKIPDTLYQGLRWKDKDGVDCESVVTGNACKNGKRKAKYVETSWVGTQAFGASHYYARIDVARPSIRVGNDLYSMAGYGPEYPEHHLESLSIKVSRRLSKVEKDINGEVIGAIGDKTTRFDHPETARSAAIQTFLRKFGPGWVLCEETEEESDKIIAET